MLQLVSTRSLLARANSAHLMCVAAFVALACWGCGERQESTSDTMHDADRPTRGTESWMWASAPENQFRTILGQLLGVSSSSFLASDHALVQRTQLWVDRIDSQLRAAHPADLANVPRPKAQVLKDGSTNAFVAPLPVCYKVPVKVRTGTATPITTADAVYLDLNKGELGAWPAEINCLEGSNALETVRSIAAKFNSTSLACKYSVSSTGSLVPGSGCVVGDDLPGIKAAKSVVVMQTAGFITVHTGLFPSMTEEAFVSVLAHELGHYYRSHTSRSETEFDFFYTMEQNAPARRPVAEPALQELGEGAVMGSTLLGASENYRTVSGATLRPELFFAAGSVVVGACNAGSCSSACREAKDYLATDAFSDATGTYPFGRAAAGEASAYAQFETKSLACLATLNMVATPGTLTATTISWDKLKGLVARPTWPSWLSMISPSVQRQLAQIAALAALRVGDDAPTAANAKLAFVAATTSLKEQDEAAIALLRSAQEQRVGQYTTEQEADDQAAEWVAETGIDPINVVEAMRSLGRGSQTSLGGMLLGETDCDTLYQNDWLAADGSYYFVPVGDYSEVHHSVCYRMFNLEREIAAHEHERANIQAPVLPVAQWRALQTQADGLAEQGNEESISTEPEVHEFAKRTGIMSCPYAYRYH